MSLAERLQPAIILGAALLGLALGRLAWLTKPAEALILPLLMILLTGTFLQVPLRQFGNMRQHGGTAMLGSAPLEGDTRNTQRRDAKDAKISTYPLRSLRFKSGEPNHPKVEHSPSGSAQIRSDINSTLGQRCLSSIPAVHEEGDGSSQRSWQILASSCDTKQRNSALFASTE